jgi:sec-independent protein translocase protein TatB
MFGLTFEKLLIVGVIGVFLVGPARLPTVAAELGRWTRRFRDMADSAKTRLRDEVGPEFDDIDWRALDPRQYDPRQIVRTALLESPPAVDDPVSAAPLPVDAAPLPVDAAPLPVGDGRPRDDHPAGA